MANNSILGSGTFSVRINGTVTKYDGDCSLSITLTGSNAASVVQTISGSGLQALSTSSLSDFFYGYFWNASGSADIIVYAGGNQISVLKPDMHSVIAWSGSASTPVPQLSASIGYGSATSTADLVYILSEM